MDDVIRNDQSVLDLLSSPYTFVNERLALHYDINTVRGDQFRKIKLTDSSRFGLLGKGGVLMTSAYPNRTSPVLRGAYVLERIMGTPPPIPPPAVEALPATNAQNKPATVRELLETHRKKPQCFSCHAAIDPIGFVLEGFDATGKARRIDRFARIAIDTMGELPDGTKVHNPDELRAALLVDPVPFVQNVTERLIMYSLGRVIEAHDMPFVRDIVRRSAADNYKVLDPHHQHRAERRFHQGQGAGAQRGSRHQAGRRHQRKGSEAGAAMFISKKHLSRRTMLRGAGAAIALPLLDAMIPASTALAQTAAKPAPRMGFIYFPHGAVMKAWSPAETGTAFTLSPILKPLEPFRSHLTIVSGLRNRGGESSDPHGIMAGTWLSCFGIKNREGDMGTTADQLAARHFAGNTPIPSTGPPSRSTTQPPPGPRSPPPTSPTPTVELHGLGLIDKWTRIVNGPTGAPPVPTR